MDKVKVGDWVEVTRTDRYDDEFINIVAGDKFLVLDVLGDTGVEVRLADGDSWWLNSSQFCVVGATGARYKKKPVEVEVVQFCVGNFSDVVKFTEGAAHSFVDNTCVIPTLGGEYIATVGDFIIKGIKGEFYPCKPDIFMETYEKI